jgi:catechol-2,3-dioxygenase
MTAKANANLTTVRAGAYLHHLQLLSPEPERVARFYADAVDMKVSQLDDHSWFCSGPGRGLLVSPGPAKSLGYAAFACRDLQGLFDIRSRAEVEGLAPQPFASPFFTGDAFVVCDPDGNRIVFGFSETGPIHGVGIKAPVQHLTLATQDVHAITHFYAGQLGFGISDRVLNSKGEVMTCFMRSNHEHHTIACFYQARKGIDHHSYETGEWGLIRDWCDRMAARNIPIMWGPGRHGPGNNLFIFVVDPDGNWVEISAELEVMYDRPVKDWPHCEHTLNLWGRAILRAPEG